MSLKGSLEDLGVVDLIQFVHQAHKSGALVLNAGAEEATLFYRKGSLVDARLGEHAGIEVLVRAIDWTAGEFEFQPGAETDRQTIQMDLHRAVMNAVKLRDERKAEEERRLALLEQSKKNVADGFQDTLSQLVSSADFLQYLCVITLEGDLLGEASGPRASVDGLENLRTCLHKLTKDYPRSEMKRLFIEDEAGTIVLVRLPADRLMIAVAERGTALGVVAVGTGKIAMRLISG